VTLLTVTVSGFDKRGNREVTFIQAGQYNALPVDGPGFERLQPLLDALEAGRVDIAALLAPVAQQGEQAGRHEHRYRELADQHRHARADRAHDRG
jgi:hypothetical protein